ncbi:MAG: hypothetical protein MUE98_07580 [Rhodobacteraceae bacterium]|nr:hypothetical protein [Paracoccaceae bacterium]
MTRLTRLRPDEMVRLERGQIAALYDSVGKAQAEEIICRAMEELAMRLALMERAYAAAELPALAKSARGLVAIAGQVGMSALARVAADVAACADRRDMPALGATLARLMRISDRSLTAVWDSADLSG